MNEPTRQPAQALHLLLHKLLYGEIDETEFKVLEQRLLGDPGARKLYQEFMSLQLGLYSRYSVVALGNKQVVADCEEYEDVFATESALASTVDTDRLQAIEAKAERELKSFLAEQERLRQEQEQQSISPHSQRFDIVETIRHLLLKFDRMLGFAWKMTIASAVLLVLTLVTVGGVQAWLRNRVVAELGASVHAVWREAITEELRPGTLFLEQGVAQLTFKKGAEVIVQAPCHLHLHSPNKMILETGTVSAKVPKSASGFTIETPSSKVIDYGTEFGVLMDAANQAEVFVFAGEVGVQSTAKTQASKLFRLTEGQNALANWAAGVQVGKAMHGDNHFMRRLPNNNVGIPGKRIDLADIVGGGNGFGTGYRVTHKKQTLGTINPITGRVNDPLLVDITENADMYPSFMPVEELPFVDGVFIPDQREGGCVINSSGFVFTQCPNTDGVARLNVANGWNLTFNETESKTWSEAIGISLHANLGLTFDLQKIRNTMPGIDIVRFVAQAGIPFSTKPEISDADIWVLVDGQVRFELESVRPPEMVDIDITLDKQVRFLTLITTDGLIRKKDANKAGGWDSCFFANPTLELEASR